MNRTIQSTTFHEAIPMGEATSFGADRRQLWRDRFRAMGLPSKKLEDWKYTDLGFLAGIPFQATGKGDPTALLATVDFGWPRLVFVNGHYVAELSTSAALPEGVSVLPLSEVTGPLATMLEQRLGSVADGEGAPMVALNGAHFAEGYVIHVPRGITVVEPIHVVFVGTADDQPVASHVRVVIVAEDLARVSCVESVVGQGTHPSLFTSVCEIFADGGASVERLRIQTANKEAIVLDTVYPSIGKDATVTLHDFELGGRVGRSELRATLDGKGATLDAAGLGVASGHQIADHFVLVDHRQPHGTSKQLFRGVFDGQSVGVFNGKVIVREGADQSDAAQSDKNLVLSDDAQANTRPQLEIYTDEVKASHGATVGKLDVESLFYLRSRGIPLGMARNLLIRAFAAEVAVRIEHDAVRSFLETQIVSELALESAES